MGYRKAGGAGRDRTGDLLNANQALSQLSYSPCKKIFSRPIGRKDREDQPRNHLLKTSRTPSRDPERIP